MNEQIEQLALRAGFNLHNDVIDGHNFKHEIEKFADLLLSRVCEICEDLGDRGLDGHYCVDKIRQEFV